MEARVALVGGCMLAVVGGCHETVGLRSIEVVPSGYSVEQGVQLQATAIGHYSDGSTKDVTATATWSSSTLAVATINTSQRVFTVGTGTTTLTATIAGKSGSAPLTVTPRRSFAAADVGLWVQIEERGAPAGYWPGDLLHQWDMQDPLVGHTVADETRLQLDTLQALGVNTITYEQRATDAMGLNDGFMPPTCNMPPTLGQLYPQPAASDLANLGALLDELQARGMKMWLMLNNTHMEEQPPTNNTVWLTAILQAVGNHPALDLIAFGGAPHVQKGGTGAMVCGIPAEAALYTGPGSLAPAYVQWAIGLGISLGVPARKLTAEAVVGAYILTTDWPNNSGDFTDNHFWWPITTLKTIFDNLGLAPADRTYALSFYEQPKCTNLLSGMTCADEAPHPWADETLTAIGAAVEPAARVVAVEMGDDPPVSPMWKTEHAYESLLRLEQQHGVRGGSFWRWTNFTDAEESDPTLADPIKRRGTSFAYNSVEKVLVDVGGWHLQGIANGSFESGADHWTSGGSGDVAPYDLTQEMGQPEVPWRGTHSLRLTTGAGASDVVTAISDPVAVQPAIVYTTTANLRLAAGDASPTATIEILYTRADGTPSMARSSDRFTVDGTDATTGFGTFPVQYVPPPDAAFAQVRFALARGGSSMPAILDVDAVR